MGKRNYGTCGDNDALGWLPAIFDHKNENIDRHAVWTISSLSADLLENLVMRCGMCPIIAAGCDESEEVIECEQENISDDFAFIYKYPALSEIE